MTKRPAWLAAQTLLLIAAVAPSTRAAEITRRDDAYHFARETDAQHAFSYAEWWYFNLSDPAQGLDLAMTYAVLDPANVSGTGVSAVTAIAYTPAGRFTETDVFPTTAFHASDQQADVVIARGSPLSLNYVDVLGDNLYRVVGSIEQQHRISWNLLYLRRRDAWLTIDRQHVGRLPWEHMSWLPYMPAALVTGDVVIDGRRYPLNAARGYHDHNWGEWLPFDVVWNWAQYAEPGLDFAVGDFPNGGPGIVGLAVGNERTAFSKDQYAVVHADWQYDAVNHVLYPTTTWIVAQNDRTTAIVALGARGTIPVLPPPEVPLPLVPVIYEQNADVLGWLWEKNDVGDWTFVRAFGGRGFNEYTAVTFPPMQ